MSSKPTIPEDRACRATLVEQLRSINKEAWAGIENPNDWSYQTNIGNLVHQAADHIEMLTAKIDEINTGSKILIRVTHFFGIHRWSRWTKIRESYNLTLGWYIVQYRTCSICSIIRTRQQKI